MDKKTNLEVLEELHKAAKMGMDSISFVAEKVGDENFKDNLSFQYTQYGDVLKKVNSIYEKYGEIPNDQNLKDQLVGWTGVQMNTITDKSNSKLADMLIQGTSMGIVEGRKLLNNNPHVESEIKITLTDFITMQENNIEKMKTFL